MQRSLRQVLGVIVNKKISLDSASVVTGISKRTLWRRIGDGVIPRQENDSRGRAMLDLEYIVPMLCVPLSLNDQKILVDADSGNADAQNELAQLFMELDKFDIATYWLQLAVINDHPDAMHNLAELYIKGISVPKDENIGLMWLAKSASYGHFIARKQIKSIISGGRIS